MSIDLISVSRGQASTSEDSSITGPLASLEGQKNFSVLVYPQDLGSSTKNHYVKFSIKQIIPSNPTQSTSDAESTLKDIGRKIITSNYTPNLTDAGGVICLYMPDTLSASYSASYDELSLTNDLGKGLTSIQAISSVVRDLTGDKQTGQLSSVDPSVIYGAASVVNKGLSGLGLGGEGLVDVALQTQGYAVNPQLQLIYRGLGFRKFQLNFIFTPASKQESIDVNRIIATFKYHFAPDLIVPSGAVSGLFFVPPSYFNIEFMFNDNENKFLPRYGDCVLTDIDVNYAPSGFAAHIDGAPVQTQLTLSFQEIEVVTKAKLAAGYGADVGSFTSSDVNGVAELR